MPQLTHPCPDCVEVFESLEAWQRHNLRAHMGPRPHRGLPIQAAPPEDPAPTGPTPPLNA
jgi:hypothetical protein